MAYDALTIDTNIAKQGGLNFEGGFLGQLAQFKDGRARLILSEIVISEIRKHLVDQVRKARDTFLSGAAKARDARLFDEAGTASLKALSDSIRDPREIAEARLARFLEATEAQKILAASASIDDLVKSYFAARPPFEATGAKKDEFPDAIALLSLEAWAKKWGQKVLAISQDSGWSAFAANSEFIDVEPDFAKALEILQEHAEAAHIKVSTWLSDIVSRKRRQIAQTIEFGLRSSLFNWSFAAEGSGEFMLDSEARELELISYQPIREGDGFDLRIVRSGSSKTVVRIGATMRATARATFSLSAYDRSGKHLVSLGSELAEKTVDFSGAFLLTLAGDLEGSLSDLLVHDVEVVEAIKEVDFGEIGFERSRQDYDRWLAEDMIAERSRDEPR